MIDFSNGSFVKLKEANSANFVPIISPILLEGEEIIGAYQGMRDGVVFTTKRIISINVQGITGKKKDITSLPYSKIQAFSVESAGMLDLDSELELYFSSLGKVKFEFTANCNITEICKNISEFVLK